MPVFLARCIYGVGAVVRASGIVEEVRVQYFVVQLVDLDVLRGQHSALRKVITSLCEAAGLGGHFLLGSGGHWMRVRAVQRPPIKVQGPAPGWGYAGGGGHACMATEGPGGERQGS